MSNKMEIRKLEGQRKRVMAEVAKIDRRIGILAARDEVAANRKNKKLIIERGTATITPATAKKGGRK